MTRKLDNNLRRGNLAEGLGVEMLRAFAAVAPVPRTEDVGIDAVVTLLRPVGRSLYAEDSCYVQFKARSVRKLEYAGEAFEWIRNLQMPMFIASVDLDCSEIELYSTHNAVSRVHGSVAGGVVLYLDPTPIRIDQQVHVDLGMPAMRWSAEQAASEGFHNRAYQIMREWIYLEQNNRRLRELSSSAQINWETNNIPIASTRSGTLWPSKEKIAAELDHLKPYIGKLASMICVQGERISTVKALAEVIEFVNSPGLITQPPEDELPVRLNVLTMLKY
jgi:hypothetical protein